MNTYPDRLPRRLSYERHFASLARLAVECGMTGGVPAWTPSLTAAVFKGDGPSLKMTSQNTLHRSSDSEHDKS